MRWAAGFLPRRDLDQHDVVVAQARMADRYQPTRAYRGPLLIVRGAPESRARWDFEWSDHATGAIDVVDVSGDQLGLLRSPAVEQIGRHVERAIG
jgi:hypothetical protein